jgi:hypothetical protein
MLRVPAASGLESLWTWLDALGARLTSAEGARLVDAWLVPADAEFVAILDGPDTDSFDWLLDETATLLNLRRDAVEVRLLRSGRDRWAFRGDPMVPDPTRRNPRPVRWERIDIGRDDRRLRIEFLHGVIDGLHHVELYEDDEEVRVTVFLGLNHDFRGGTYVLVGITAWTTVETKDPVGRRFVNDGAEA